MSLLRHINRLRYIDYVIKRKTTGSLEKFAIKNRLSKSSMSGIIKEMKELGFPIKYDRARNTYYYEENGEMVKHLFVSNDKILTREELSKIGDDRNLCYSEVRVFELCKAE